MKYIIIITFVLYSLNFATSFDKIKSKQTTNNLDNSINLDMSLDELMNTPVSTASKYTEHNFDAPLDVDIITKEDIKISGINNIAELLKLIKGFIVQEETNGNFNIYSKGFDNIPNKAYTFFSENTTMLVMIDSRKIYEYGIGGVFWESIPLSIDDIDKIEIIQAPSSAMYGPNAVTTVINIITNNQNDSTTFTAKGDYSSLNSINSSMKINRIVNNFKLTISGNYSKLNRSYDKYYNFTTGHYTTRDSLYDYANQTLIEKKFNADTALSQLKEGINLFCTYNKNNTNINFSTGYQSSKAQSVFMETTSSMLSSRLNKTFYANTNININNLHSQASISVGDENIFIGKDIGGQSNVIILNTLIENLFKYKNLNIQPGIDYQKVIFNDLPYNPHPENHSGYINGEVSITNIGTFLRFEQKFNKLRFIEAIRGDYYDTKENFSINYQLISTYKYTNSLIFKLNYSTATRSPFIYYSYTYYKNGENLLYKGNRDLNLLKTREINLNITQKINNYVSINNTIFYRTGTNFTNFLPTQLSIDSALQITYSYVNISDLLYQKGLLTSINIMPTNKFKIKLYGTLQQTTIKNHQEQKTPLLIDTQNMNFSLPTYDTINITNNSTPTIFGGITVTCQPHKNITLFSNIYGMSHYVYSHEFANYNENYGTIMIKPFIIWDINSLYSVNKNISMNFSIKNLLNYTQPQFGFADFNKRKYKLGLQFKL